MSDQMNMVLGLAALIRVVDPAYTAKAAESQARLYVMERARDGRISDATYQATVLARMIGVING
jgi:hypothetical protein